MMYEELNIHQKINRKGNTEIHYKFFGIPAPESLILYVQGFNVSGRHNMTCVPERYNQLYSIDQPN